MRKYLAAATALFVTALVGVAGPAAAGGWAVTSLDPLPATPEAGEPLTVGMTIRQHGVTPVAVDDVAIVVRDAAGATTEFAALPDGPVGHYVATVELPARGSYHWAVRQGWFGEQDLGTLDVGAPAAAAPAGSGGGDDGSPLTVPLALVAAALVGAGLYDLGRSSGRRRAAA